MATAQEIWNDCQGESLVEPIDGVANRIVESQEQVATTSLVNGDLHKQAVLERLLEDSKPPRIPGTEHLDYLLATPWRYPPLPYGSRYGSIREPSLFYGGLGHVTTFAECAYYRLVFFFDMNAPPVALSSRHTLFEINYQTEKGIRLHRSRFDKYRDELISRSNYTVTQGMGEIMRTAGVCAFEFPSARDNTGGNNLALIQPSALTSTRPQHSTSWLCTTNHDQVAFSYRGQPAKMHTFATHSFFDDGVFPRPA